MAALNMGITFSLGLQFAQVAHWVDNIEITGLVTSGLSLVRPLVYFIRAPSSHDMGKTCYNKPLYSRIIFVGYKLFAIITTSYLSLTFTTKLVYPII